MDQLQESVESQEIALTPQQLAADLRQIQQRSWWFWSNAVLVMSSLAGVVVSFLLPTLLNDASPFFKFNLSQAVRSLVALVLLFNVYSFYQQIRIKSLCDELTKKHARAESFRKLAIFDPLTGLYNRRFGEPRLAAEVARSQRNGTALTLLVLDLNQFKQINDRYGHAAGDFVLKEFASRVNRAIRGSDLAVRLGGDEFMVVLPECSGEQLRHVLGRLVPLQVTWERQKIPVTFAAGWKEYELGETPEGLLELADKSLYRNKRDSFRGVDSKHFTVEPLV